MGDRAQRLLSKVKRLVSGAAGPGPQRVVLALGSIVVLLVLIVGWFVVTRDDDGEVETVEAGGAETTTTTVATTTTAPTTTEPEATTTTLSEAEQAELEVIEAYEAAVEVGTEAAAEPVDPDHPELEEHYVGGALNERRNNLESMENNGWALRYPEDSLWEIDVRSVTFEEVDGVEEAHLEICWVTDGETYWIENGQPVPHLSGIRTIEISLVMRKIDRSWLVADGPPDNSEEGITGCALD